MADLLHEGMGVGVTRRQWLSVKDLELACVPENCVASLIPVHRKETGIRKRDYS
jgi:hypothetical protein